jgi:hypothetical protein
MSRSGIVSFNKFLCVELRVSVQVVAKLLLPFIFTSITFAQFNYPLHVGDYWEYTMFNQPLILKQVISNDSLLPNGKVYSVVRDYDLKIISKLERQEGLRIYRYDDTLQGEYVVFDFSKNPFETVSTTILGNDTIEIYYRGSTLHNIFALNRLQHFFIIEWNHMDAFTTLVLTDSLGITNTINSFYVNAGSTLIYAKINGNIYGNPSESVKEDFQPMNYMLSQNYPNPFNPTTNITFNLRNSHHTTLKVYNILGKEVETLINEKLESGQHYVTWNAKNFPSGLYYYRLICGDFIETKKMILMK